MSPRTLLRIALLVLVALVSSQRAGADQLMTNSLAIVSDVASMEREVVAGDLPFELSVVYTNPQYPLGAVASVHFRVLLDPGLTLLGSSTTGLQITPQPGEFALSFPNCLGEAGPEPFVVLQLVVSRDESAAPGARIRLAAPGDPDGPLVAYRCADVGYIRLANFGGVIVNPSEPVVAGFVTSPTVVVEGREYELGWATGGSDEWSLDGTPVARGGVLEILAEAGRTHSLSAPGSPGPALLSPDLTREPRILEFQLRPHSNPDQFWVDWDVAGAHSVLISGIGTVDEHGSQLFDHGEYAGVELFATNEWGASARYLEIKAPIAPPVIEDFHADPEAFTVGQTVFLHYEVTDATTLSIEPDVGLVPVFGDRAIAYPEAATTYVLRAENALGVATAQVRLEEPKPRILYFRTSPAEFFPGEAIDLAYGVEGADSLWIEPGPVLSELAGTLPIVAPDSVATYVLVAENSGGRSTQELTVASLPPRIHVVPQIYYVPTDSLTIKYWVWGADRVVIGPENAEFEIGPDEYIWFGTYQTLPSGPVTYWINAINRAGTTTQVVNVRPWSPRVNSFNAEPLPTIMGEDFAFVWDVTGADDIAILDVPGIDPNQFIDAEIGRFEHAFEAPFTGRPRILARNEWGTRVAYLGDYLRVHDPNHTIRHFYAEDPVLERPGSTTLNYRLMVRRSWRIGPPTRSLGYRVGSGLFPVVGSFGTNAWVLEENSVSPAYRDTAWVVVDPVSTFVVDKAINQTADVPPVYPGEQVTMTWSAPGADRVTLSPFIGEVSASGGTLVATVDQTTEYRLSAWYDGRREVIERAVIVSEPTLTGAGFTPNPALPSEPVTFEWVSAGATEVWLQVQDSYYTDLPAEGSVAFDSPPYGRWHLQVSNASGYVWTSGYLEAPYVEIEEFQADPPEVLLGEATTLTWDVSGVEEVEIEGYGTYPPAGELVVYPLESRGFELTGMGAFETAYRVAPVRVDVDEHSPATLMVSASPDEYLPEVEPIDTGIDGDEIRYEFWVRAENVLGTILRVYFALDIPDWLEVETLESSYAVSSADKLETEFGVFMGECASGEVFNGPLVHVVLRQVATPPDSDPGSISIHSGPPPGQSVPVGPKWHWCGPPAEFGFALPGMQPVISPPLMIASHGVSALVLPLDMAWTSRGLELSWSDRPELDFVMVELLRGTAPGNLAPLATVTSALTWTDPDAADLYEDGPLFYQLRAIGRDGARWQSPEVAVTGSPVAPPASRTRLIGARPNPFNPNTTIHWELAHPGAVTIAIYDLSGRRVREWTFSGQQAGPGTVDWNGTDDAGRSTASGVYIVRLVAEGMTDSKRVTLVK